MRWLRSHNIEVKDLNLLKFGFGVLLPFTQQSTKVIYK